MQLQIVKNDTDCVDYLTEVKAYIAARVKTQDQLESRFDAILTDYAINKRMCGYDCEYTTDAVGTRELRIYS